MHGIFLNDLSTVVQTRPKPNSRGSTRKNVIFSNSLWTNSEYPISLKSMSIWSLQSFVEKNDPFLTYDPPKVSVFLALVTELVTDLDSLVTDPVLALALRNRMYLSGGLVM